MSAEALEKIEHAVQHLDLNELDTAKRVIEREHKQREKEARKQAQAEMKAVAEKYGVSLHEIVAGQTKSSGGSKGKVPPKYCHPEDPDKTWTGRGRRPHWVQNWLDAGGDLEDLRI
ncbi:H-NS histone family protein [Halorhodospira halochloris]|uniref:DNA-binding protein n=1 Tax=Halorhodospira halochloris TaxID=1052 RepID=A0A0X8XCG6_HALHR|nr:H-NS histone family protein [Halorhodospira halochloris]MBK1652835.1 trans-acting regulatory HvrA protein [Halorhodospira halochloris]MCG5531504.1 H-NS histone family protein [Halorhodospira halochloris]MCG5549445.1 H-NS histone family protein [Halorhodospira halochloris]BAU58059.1 DNA-binding protein [Halorhodospira halochloris]